MMKKLFLLLILSATSLFAQYDISDSELARTTFERTFDRKIVDRYLTSNLPANVKAGLLSISNSQDTSFVKDIVKLDYSKYGNYMAFALGELGASAASNEYLLSQMFPCKSLAFQRSGFDALGRIGDINLLERLIIKYFTDKNQNYDGISVALANMALRNIKVSDSSDYRLIFRELSNTAVLIKRRIDAAFALSRLAVPPKVRAELIKLLFGKEPGEEGIILKQYILASVRKLKTSPEVPEQIKALSNHPDWRIRTEATKVLCYSKFRLPEDLKNYFSFFKDINPNVSRQAAISIKEAKVDSTLKTYLRDNLSRMLGDSTLTANTRGELFVSFSKFFPTEVWENINMFGSHIDPIFIYSTLSENLSFPQKNLSYLLKNVSATNKMEILEAVGALLPLQQYLRDNPQLTQYLLNGLSKGFPAEISIIAEGLDTAFIKSNKDELQRIILKQIHLYVNDANYLESSMSLTELSGKISESFRKEILLALRSSTLYSVQLYACKQMGKECKAQKEMSNFTILWSNAFKYRSAKVNTGKGSFTIQFTPEYAPLSVGNFCYLSSTGFYKNIVFHRVVPDFVIQAGDPQGTGWGGPGYDIISELSPVTFDRSYVGMASAGKDTEGSQWFVMHSNYPHLNGRYSNFGKVITGMDVVSTIDQGDVIISVELLK